jgi:phosphohistidine phosphatase
VTGVQSRTLVLVRHGRAEGNDPRLPDFERRLDPRGQAEATSLGVRLLARRLASPRILSSPALRTLETAQRIRDAIACRLDALETRGELYLAGVEVLADVVRARGGDSRTLIVVGHNPGISDFAQWLSPASKTAGFETGEGWIATLPLEHWADLAPACASAVAREPAQGQQHPVSRNRPG